MKADEILALIKSGMNEFYELDIEGSFINKNLSSLYFERCFFVADFSGANLTKTVFDECNLKTCDFSYCGLNDSTFKNNCLDAAEFKFVQFNNLTFKNNSAYGCDFTKDLLEDMQFTNYPGFHIAGIKAGWFDVLLVDRAKTIYITASNYLGHDAPFELLKAVNDFNSGDKSKTNWISWGDEPGTYIWKLERQNETININIYESQTIPKDRKHLEKEETYRIDFETNGEFLGFVKEVATSFEKAKKLDDESKYYEKEWRHKFPDAELYKMRSFIHTIRQNRS
jgi:uncharacterized protein YjbI with pentapeptide repeats